MKNLFSNNICYRPREIRGLRKRHKSTSANYFLKKLNQIVKTGKTSLQNLFNNFCQGCGSGFNRVSGSESGSRREKMTHKSRIFV